MKFREKIKAIRLRKKGLNYSDILKEVNVSKSTLSLWLRDIDLTLEQQKKLLVGRERSRYVAGKKKKELRILKTKEIVERSKEELTKFINNNLFLTGLALYWAEGTKHEGEVVRFTNSDPAMISIMMKWFRDVCHISEQKFRIQIHTHNLHSRPEIEKYWSTLTKVPLGKFYKTYIKNSTLGQRRNILYSGTCVITINSKELFRKIKGWKFGLQEYFNISP